MATAAGYCSYLAQFCYCYCCLHFQQQTHRLMALIELIITAVAWLTPAITIVDAYRETISYWRLSRRHEWILALLYQRLLFFHGDYGQRFGSSCRLIPA